MEEGLTANNIMNDKERMSAVNKVSFTTLAVNVALALVKVTAGIIAHSSAMVADGVHTVSDVVTTVAVIVGVRFSSRDADESHPYGHERIEGVVAAFLSLVLLATAFGIGRSGVLTILSGKYTRPGAIALAAAVFSIVSKEIMYSYTIKTAERINSPALKADAWHHRSDALSSVGTLVGIGGAMLGIGVLDPIASLVVCVLIIKVGLEIFMQAMDQLVDKSADREIIENIRQNIWDIEGVKDIDDIKTRIHGSRIFVDVEISVDGETSVTEGHIIAENVHNRIETAIGDVKHCMVHVNPYKYKHDKN